MMAIVIGITSDVRLENMFLILCHYNYDSKIFIIFNSNGNFSFSYSSWEWIIPAFPQLISVYDAYQYDFQ